MKLISQLVKQGSRTERVLGKFKPRTGNTLGSLAFRVANNNPYSD